MKKLFVIPCIFLFVACNSNHSKQDAVQDKREVLLSNTAHQASCVYLTSDGNNEPVISWCEIDTSSKQKYFFLAFFKSDSNTFSAPISVPVMQSVNIHEEGMPKMAVKSDGTILAVYETSAPTKENEYAGFIYYIQSHDKGKTWTEPAFLHKNTLPGKDHSFASVARLDDGEIGACWLDESLDTAKHGRSVLFAKTDGSQGFGDEILIDSSACECCRTAISCDKDGRVRIVYRNIGDSSVRDISVCASNNNGESFSQAVSFSNDGWVIDGCPHNGPCVATANGATYATWYTGGAEPGIYYGQLDGKGKMNTKKYISENGRFAQLCILPENEILLAYNQTILKGDSFYSPIVLDKIVGDRTYQKMITTENQQATYPVLKPLSGSKVVVAWRVGGKIFYKTVNTSLITNPAPTVQKQQHPKNAGFSTLQQGMMKDKDCRMR